MAPRAIDAVRGQLNRGIVALTLLVLGPAIVVAERLRAGAGRRVAVGTLRRLARVCGLRLEVLGTELLDPGRTYVFVPNHTSHLDVVVLFLARPDATFVATHELFSIPILAAAMRALGTIPIDRRDRRGAGEQLDAMGSPGAPTDFVVFAEGGIVPAGERWRFKTGAAVLALQTGAALVPVAIHGAAELAPPTRRLLVRPGLVRVELLAPISTDGLTLADRKHLRTEVEDAVRSAISSAN